MQHRVPCSRRFSATRCGCGSLSGGADAVPGARIGCHAAAAHACRLWVVGAGCYVYGQHRGVPHGYKLISFDDLQPDPDVSGEVIPPAALELNDKKVFIRGYMYPGRQYTRIKQFILVPTFGHCNFCSRMLKSSDMIRIKLVGDLMTDYKNRIAGFGGTLRIDQEQASRPFGGVPYEIDADEVR